MNFDMKTLFNKPVEIRKENTVKQYRAHAPGSTGSNAGIKMKGESIP
jgi:hypothetical protein